MGNQEKDKFENYNPEVINSLVVVITDKPIYNEEGDKYVPETKKDQFIANDFVDKLIAFCESHRFTVESYGTRLQMAGRLNNKDIISEEKLYEQIKALQDDLLRCHTDHKKAWEIINDKSTEIATLKQQLAKH